MASTTAKHSSSSETSGDGVDTLALALTLTLPCTALAALVFGLVWWLTVDKEKKCSE